MYFFPQQLQGHLFAFQLLMNCAPLGQLKFSSSSATSTRVQMHEQRFIGQLLGQRLTQPCPCDFIQQILNRTHAGIGVSADLSDRHSRFVS